MRILFVCLGNICRSPTAEAVLRHKAPHLMIDSAGTSGWHVGEPPYPPMQKAARRRGYDLSPLRGRAFTPDDFGAFDLIIAMDAQNRADVERLRPQESMTPVGLLTEHRSKGEADHIPDPYFTRDFDGCLDLIENCVDGLVEQLSRISPAPDH